jgi:hypothetical protein
MWIRRINRHKNVTRRSLPCHPALFYFAPFVAPSWFVAGWKNKKKQHRSRWKKYNDMKIRKFTLMAGIAGLMAATAQAQFTAGKLAVLRAGDNGTSAASSLNGAKQSPTFIDQYDPVNPISISNTNTGTNGPIYSVAIPTNDPGALWFNGHAGTEGYLAQSGNADSLSFSGYGGDILAQSGTPSQLPINRGICVIDVSGNSYIPYEGSDWYGLGAGTQTNPRGVVSDDGTNNFFGSGSLDGTEWYSPSQSDPPVTVQNLSSMRDVKIINGVFYTSLQEGDGGGQYPQGIYNLITFDGTFPVTLPEGDSFFLNLVVPASALYPNVEGFDMNPQRNIAYTADNTYGIQKYVEVDGNWTLACAFGILNNTSSGAPIFPASYTGCFGLVVDWSGSYPVVFATTTEGNGGYANSNRVIRIDDNYNFTDGNLHTNDVSVTTLATGWSGNVAFRGLAWTPDRRPVITGNLASQSVAAGTPVTFTVSATGIVASTYQWFVNGVLDGSQTTATYNAGSATLGDSGNTYQVIVGNSYGSVTSTLATLTVTSGATAPHLTSPVPALNLSAAVYDTITIPVTTTGTTPLNYSWYQSTSPGSTTQLTGGDFSGTATGTLTINVSSASDSGSYYVVINNTTGTPTSNLVATVTIVTPLPVIFVEPLATEVVASNGLATFTTLAYPLDASYQWYYKATPSSSPTELHDGGRWVGSQNTTLSNIDVQGTDGGYYYAVVSYNGGSVTSSAEFLTIAPPAAYSALPYTSPGMVYTQDFDTLPDPGVKSVNTKGGGTASIDGTNYNVSNPFDFAAALSVEGDNGLGGLNLPAMQGWYASAGGSDNIQATSGDNTTGLIVSFGCTNAINTVNPLYPTNNRALGMITSSSTSFSGNAGDPADAVFALRIRNLTGHVLTNMNLSYVSELWRNTTVSNIFTNFYYVDTLGTNTTPTNGTVTGILTNLTFSTNLGGPFSKTVTFAYGTNQPISATNMSFVDVPLATNCPEGGIIWIVWEAPISLSGGQGFGIDNLVFSSGTPSLSISQTGSSVAITWPQMFTAFTLQYNTTASATGWQNLAITPPVTETVSNGMNIVTVPASATQRYYRLLSTTGF